MQDGVSGLVYNAAFRPELMNYDAAYQNEQAHNPLFKSHVEQIATIVERNLGADGLVEVASVDEAIPAESGIRFQSPGQ